MNVVFHLFLHFHKKNSVFYDCAIIARAEKFNWKINSILLIIETTHNIKE